MSTSTETTNIGWGVSGTSGTSTTMWDLSGFNKSSSDIKSVTSETQGLINFEANFIKENNMSTHQYTADFASRRNKQNNREFLATLPPKMVELITVKTVADITTWTFSMGTGIAANPNEHFGLSEENPDKIVRHVKWK